MKLTMLTLAIGYCAIPIFSLGINCRGSGRCVSCNIGSETLAAKLKSIVTNTSATYEDGRNIACIGCKGIPKNDYGLNMDAGSLCVFPQNLNGGTVTGQQVLDGVDHILKHNCKGCGSAPVKEGNDVSTGEITMNFAYCYADDIGGVKLC